MVSTRDLTGVHDVYSVVDCDGGFGDVRREHHFAHPTVWRLLEDQLLLIRWEVTMQRKYPRAGCEGSLCLGWEIK